MTETDLTRRKTLWAEATASGALSLIPARKYPAWLRHTLSWGSTALVVAAVLAPAVVPQFNERVSDGARAKGADDHGVAAESADRDLAVRFVAAGFAGALVHGLGRFSFWLDDAAEHRLRAWRVPYPRVVMSVAAAVLYVVIDEADRRAPNQSGPAAD